MVTTSENGFVEEPDDSRLRKTGGLARFQFEGKFADGCENPPAMSNDSTIGRSVYACAGSPPRVARVNLWMGAMASESPFNIPFTSELLRDAIAVMSWGASIYHTGISPVAPRTHCCALAYGDD